MDFANDQPSNQKEIVIEMIGDTDDKDVFNVDKTSFFNFTPDKKNGFNKRNLEWSTAQRRRNYGFCRWKYGYIVKITFTCYQ